VSNNGNSNRARIESGNSVRGHAKLWTWMVRLLGEQSERLMAVVAVIDDVNLPSCSGVHHPLRLTLLPFRRIGIKQYCQ